MSRLQRLCVQWPRFGPYHLARLEACARRLPAHGWEVVGLETAADDDLYAWGVADGPVPFRREQVFPGRVFERIPPHEMEAGVTEALDRLQPDAVAIMSYGYPDARAALAWCRRHRRVAINMTDSKEDDGVRVGWREWIKRRIVGEFDAALVAGTPQRRYLERLGMPADRIVEGYNVVDNAYYAAAAAAARQHPERVRHLPGLDDPTPAFLFIGRFLAVKNLDGLLRAYAAYRARVADPWRLLLVGDGPERARLDALVRDAQIAGVTLSGFLPPADVASYLGRAAALVLPSHKDTWGLVVNEAMAAGLPVLVSQQCGCAEDLVEDGVNGFTFPSGDLDRLTHVLAEVSAPHTDRVAMGAQSRARIAPYTPALFADRLLDAARRGAARADRRADPVARGALAWLRRTSRSVTAHHSTPV